MDEKRKEAMEILKVIMSNPSVTIETNRLNDKTKFLIGLHDKLKDEQGEYKHTFISMKDLLKDIENQLK